MTLLAQIENNALVQSLDLGGSGLRVAVKDCIDIAGTVSACGSQALRNSPPAPRHADVVATAITSDCRIVGKTNMHELAFGMTGVNNSFGTPINPRWPDLIPGGSSSGSAVALAAGLCDFALGTDTGGSVRQPAICCGLFGMKPTFGRISRAGCHPAKSSLDCVGLFARNAKMLTQAMDAIDPTFLPSTLSSAVRLARVKCDPDKAIGDMLIYAIMDGLPDAGYITLPFLDAAFEAGMTIMAAEAAQAYGHLIDAEAPLGPDIQHRLEKARSVTAAQVSAAKKLRDQFTDAVDTALTQFDALITPALPQLPPSLKQAKDPATVLPLTKFLRPFNLSGHPAIVLPILTVPDGLPAGIQIIGHKGEDAKLCAIAEWMAKTLPAIHQEDFQ